MKSPRRYVLDLVGTRINKLVNGKAQLLVWGGIHDPAKNLAWDRIKLLNENAIWTILAGPRDEHDEVQ